jgi:putative spermidine/putrescine transport system substrate-binding protein
VSDSDTNRKKKSASRRQILKGAAAVAGAAIGSGAVRGFPTIWAQNIKDITINHVGGPWAVIKEIGEQASKDLGFTVEMQPTDIQSEIQRALTQPKSIDIFQSEETTNKYLEHAGVFKPIHVNDYKLWDKTLSMFTEGKFPDGRPIPNIGMSPMKAGFWTGPDAKKFADHPTDWLTMLPTLFNADTLGIRPDLVGGEDKVTSWGDLLEPKYKGRSSLCSLAIVGVTDAAMALQARGEIKYGDMGNMTRAEIDNTFQIMNKIKQSGFFRAFWGSFDESVNLMAAGEVVIQSMISPAVTAVKARNIPLLLRPAEGRLPRLDKWHRSDGASERSQPRLRDGVHQLVQFRLAGRLYRQAGLLLASAGNGEKISHTGGVGLLVRREAGRRRYEGPVRQPRGQERRNAGRRLPMGARGAHCRLEYGDGRRPVYDASLERVHRRLGL